MNLYIINMHIENSMEVAIRPQNVQKINYYAELVHLAKLLGVANSLGPKERFNFNFE